MNGPFTSAPHDVVLIFLVQCGLLLLTARIFGEIAQRLKQPSVVGEILAGVVLGPSLLGHLPAIHAWTVPEPGLQGHLLEAMSLVGAMFLLLITGMETDLRLIRTHARTAIGVSLGGILTTLATGFALGWSLPADMRGPDAEPFVFAAFVATAMSISAIPVIAKVLMDLGLMRRDIGQTILAAGMSDDTVGWILLSIVVGLAGGGDFSMWNVLGIVGTVLLFLLGSMTVGYALVDRAVGWCQDRLISRDRMLTLVVVLMFSWAALTQALELEAVLGAFVMGILLGRVRRLPHDVVTVIERMALGVFAPIFFATAGLKVDLPALLEPRLALIAVAVIFVATFGKVVGTYAGARLIGRRPHWNALAYGAGLNARGAMEIIIATIGLKIGILSVPMFSVIVVMAITTSLMAPTALRWVVHHIQPDAQEVARLRREASEAGSAFGSIQRVLVPSRVRTDEASSPLKFEAWLLEHLDPGLVVTLSTVVPDNEQRTSAVEYLAKARAHFTHREVAQRVVVHDDAGGAILSELEQGYDLLVLGATEAAASEGVVFSTVVDAVVKGSPCPTLIISGVDLHDHLPPKRLLVASNGSAPSRHAAELAVRIAAASVNPPEVTVVHVLEVLPAHVQTADGELMRRRRDAAEQNLAGLRVLGEGRDVAIDTLLLPASNAETAILELAARRSIDVILIGTSVSVGTSNLYMGRRVERILRDARCPVVVVNIA